jgi:hypothetical protein
MLPHDEHEMRTYLYTQLLTLGVFSRRFGGVQEQGSHGQ